MDIKRTIFIVLSVFVILFFIYFVLTILITSNIQLKLDELNKNGFNVTNESYNNFLKTSGNGEIKIVDTSKVLDYFLNKSDFKELKEEITNILSFIKEEDKKELLNGLTFDYDFTILNINSSLDLNLYLTKFPIKYTQENSIYNDKLKNIEIHINIDEYGNFSASNISFIFNKSEIFIQDLTSSNKDIQISHMQLIPNKSLDEAIFIEDANIFYNEDNNKIISKLNIENIEYNNFKTTKLNLKNLKLSTSYFLDYKNLKYDTKISIDELKHIYNDGFDEIIILKDTSFVVSSDKLLYKKIKELRKEFGLDIYSLSKRAKIFETLANSDFTINIQGNSKELNRHENILYKDLKFNANLVFNKNSLMKFDSLNDIFSVLKANIEVDKTSFKKLKQYFSIDFKSQAKLWNSSNEELESHEELKKVQIELKEDGLYVDNVLTSKGYLNSYYNLVEGYNSSNVSYTYELVAKNILRVNFKYKTSLKDISSAGICVSFPQFTQASKALGKDTKTFKQIDFYSKGDTVYSGILGKNLVAKYLIIEAWDDSWGDINNQKEFSVDFDISNLDNAFEIKLRGFSVTADKLNYELAPNYGEPVFENGYSLLHDQQGYSVKIANIDLFDFKIGQEVAPKKEAKKSK